MIRPYLCGPINGCTDSEANDWREAALFEWPYAINPMVRDYRGIEHDSYREIVELDKRDIRACNVVLVNYSKPSAGTSMEIFYAHSLGIPVVLWCPPDVSLSPWLRYHSTTIVHDWASVLNAVHRCMG